MEIRFNNLASLHWLWAVLALAVIVGFALAARKRRLLRFAAASVLGRLVPPHAAGRCAVRAGLVLGAMFLLVVGLLDPRWGVTYQEVQQEGIDIFVVLDVSRSMRAEDARPRRLDRARLAVLDLLDQLQGDRIGLITFAGTPAVSCPLTIDYGAFSLSLAEADPRWVPKGGSNLGDAIRLAADSFTDDVKEHKAIIVFSDGEDHGSYPVEAASRVHEEKGIQVYTVGIGNADEGARIPVERDGRRTYLTYDGQEVWSVMNASMLRDVALSAGGAFIPVGTGAVDLGRVYQERIAPTTRRQFGTSRVKRYHVKYQWFAAAALVLLLVESLVSDRRGWLAGGRTATVAATCLLASVLVGAGPPPVAPDETPAPAPGPARVDLGAARTAFEAGDFVLAAELYEQAHELLPDSPEVLYNLGVARYRNGEYEEAARRFEETINLADRDDLRTSSLFNLGNAAYARSRDALAGFDEAQPDMEQLEAVIERLDEALENYRRAIEVDPSDEDAKVNGENAWRLLKQLEEIQERLQQQQQQQQQQNQDENQEQQDQQQQQQQQQQDQSQNEQDEQDQQQQQQQQDQGDDEQQQQQQQQQKQQQEQEQQDQPQDQPRPGEDEQEQQEQPMPTPDDEPPMTQDEARRLLQMVRDKEKQRREEQLEAAAETRDEVDKDW